MLGNYLITEDTTMKAFKKLMAAALVCVMALTMLTGCGVANNQTEKHMVEALNNAAKAAKVSYTYERTDALDKIADSALETAKKNGKIADAEKVSGDYVVYYKELDKTWNSVDKLKSAAEAAQKKFSASLEDKSGKKAVGITTGKVGGDNYVIAVVKAERKG